VNRLKNSAAVGSLQHDLLLTEAGVIRYRLAGTFNSEGL
jgi:hypothetical protein